MGAKEARGSNREATRERAVSTHRSEVDHPKMIFKRALEVISPPSDDEAECRQKITMAIRACRRAVHEKTLYSQASRCLDRIVRLTEERQRAIDELSGLGFFVPGLNDRDAEFWRRGYLISDMGDHPDISTRRARELAQSFRNAYVGTRRPPKIDKLFAATEACKLLVRYGKRPTLTADGPFLRLASIIYEGATAVPNVDLERQCRTALKEFRKH
jgi:hypothetical protein